MSLILVSLSNFPQLSSGVQDTAALLWMLLSSTSLSASLFAFPQLCYLIKTETLGPKACWVSA